MMRAARLRANQFALLGMTDPTGVANFPNHQPTIDLLERAVLVPVGEAGRGAQSVDFLPSLVDEVSAEGY
jgi:hypothetical protein